MGGGHEIEELEQNIAVVARSLFSRGTVEGTLQLTVELAIATIDGCDFAGILLIDADDQHTSVAASDAIVTTLDAVQLATSEGPCLDAARQGARSMRPTWPRIPAGRVSVSPPPRRGSAVPSRFRCRPTP